MTERLHFYFSLSCIGEGNGSPLQYSCLENPRDRGAWWATVYGVAQSWTWLKRLSSSSRNTLRDKCVGDKVLLLFSHSVLSDCATPWTETCQSSLPFISWSLLKLMSIESVMSSNILILCCPLLLRPSIFPSIRVFPNELALCIRWPEYWSFSFSYQSFQWIFRTDFL